MPTQTATNTSNLKDLPINKVEISDGYNNNSFTDITQLKNSKRRNILNTFVKLNTICPYYTMFPLDFPLRVFKKARINDWVLDPFCGRGTTLFAARLKGLNAVGIDSNPNAAAVSAAKLVEADPDRVIKLLREIMSDCFEPLHIPNSPFWSSCYHPITLRDICKLREYLLLNCNSPEAVMLQAVILGILHGPLRKGKPTYLSNQMPRTFATKHQSALRFWANNNLLNPPLINVEETITRRVSYSIKKGLEVTGGEVILGDARYTKEIIDEKYRFDWVVTSPPYFGMNSYRRDQWLRNWFLGDLPEVKNISEGEITHTKELFESDLVQVWQSVACVCKPGAKLVIRFGSLPSKPLDAGTLIKRTINKSDSGWRIITKKNAGSAINGYRQANQFNESVEMARPEFDLYARLEV